ncbi:ankyrin repeat domain-containing protein [Novosphingobium sp. ST904]|uniref:ankyrin repeat domain-containing protein n=1 Tax=Novosphingobium sp. ST904 TaxID=1684385 RepID=UPI0010E6FDA9|nr:ankyrin repeat domain-containing protein [Novosphingobium sp. ST904]TCM37076.1 ankyrin repeat protein [Novosphingobium sp. ST904]
MKSLAIIIGSAALATRGDYLMPKESAPWASISDSDTELFWQEVSGPNGERAPAALPLYQAVFAHDREAVTRLLDLGASPNAVLYAEGWSPLMVAVAYHDKEVVSLLLRHGANIDYVSNDPADYTPLAVALNADLGDALRRGGDDPKIDFVMFDYLLDAGANLNVEFGNHQDIATFSASLGQMDIVNKLLAQGYRRDLVELKGILGSRQVSEDVQADKDRAIATIDRMLGAPGTGAKAPEYLRVGALLSKFRGTTAICVPSLRTRHSATGPLAPSGSGGSWLPWRCGGPEP